MVVVRFRQIYYSITNVYGILVLQTKAGCLPLFALSYWNLALRGHIVRPGHAYIIPLFAVCIYRSLGVSHSTPRLRRTPPVDGVCEPACVGSSNAHHTMGIHTSARCDFDHSIGAFSFITQLRYADKRIGNTMEV